MQRLSLLYFNIAVEHNYLADIYYNPKFSIAEALFHHGHINQWKQ